MADRALDDWLVCSAFVTNTMHFLNTYSQQESNLSALCCYSDVFRITQLVTGSEKMKGGVHL